MGSESSAEREAVYVYGVAMPVPEVPAGATGIGDPPAPVETVGHGTLGALVSRVPARRIRATRRDLGAHVRVLQEVMETATVLPMRFGVLFPDEERVRVELLEARRTELESLAARMERHVQLDVRAFYDEEALLRGIVENEPAIARLRGQISALPPDATHFDRIRLGEMVAAAVEERRVADERLVLDRLRPFASEVAVEPGASERIAFKGSFLVERDGVERFDRAVDELAAGLAKRMRFKYVGPLAPHAFVELEATDGAPSEAAAWAS
jgi:hypothetical protein